MSLKTEILLRAESHYCALKFLEICDTLGLRYFSGLSRSSRLQEQIQAQEASSAARYTRNRGQKVRRFNFFAYAAGSWPKIRRLVALVEACSQRRDSRYHEQSEHRAWRALYKPCFSQ